jgi:hypothetical protein
MSLACLFLPACAFVDQKVELPYSKTNASKASNAKPIMVAKPKDGDLPRGKGGRIVIGMVKNGFGMKTADVLSDNSVSDWVAAALKDELDQAGFSATLVSELPSHVSRGISVNIEHLSVEPDMGFITVGDVCHIKLGVQLWKGAQKVREFKVESFSNPRSMVTGWASKKAKSLELAVRECSKKVVAEIKALE